MTRSILAALILTLGATTAISQTSAAPPRPLIEWDISEITPESMAACGSFLAKIGLLFTRSEEARHDSDTRNTVVETLFRGIALSTFSKENNPALQAEAFAAEFDPKGQRGELFLLTCTLQADTVIEDGMIPQEIIDHAMQEAVKIMIDRT